MGVSRHTSLVSVLHLERIGRHGGWADDSTALLGYFEEADRWSDNPITGL
ncbi:hypothetical protein ACIBCT_10555 [Streptosporangium sp. NPDC050855]